MNKFSPFVAVLAGALIFSVLAMRFSDFDPEIDGFGKNWQAFSIVEYDGHLVKGTPDDVANTASIWKRQGRTATALWLGASQLHTVSSAGDGENIAVFHANRHAAERDASLGYTQLSYGNANLYELLSSYLKARQRGFTPDTVILAVTYDDLREPGVRKEVIPAAGESLISAGGPGIENLLSEIGSGEPGDTAPVARSATEGTPQENLEVILTRTLEKIWPAYGYRQRLKGVLVIAWKEQVARLVLGSERRSSIRVDRALVEYNMLALDALRRITSKDQTRLLIYRAPLLKQSKFSYYVYSDYEAFADTLVQYCAEFGIPYRDFDNLIQANSYGKTNSGLPDYFHFDEQGHRILARSVDEWITQLDN